MQNTDGETLLVANDIMEEDTQETRVELTLSANVGVWMTLAQIANLSGVRSETSVASRIRDLRYYGLFIEKRLQAGNPPGVRIFEYKYL